MELQNQNVKRNGFVFQQYGDVHLPAALLKSFLRQLPEPIMTFDLYDHTVRVQCKSNQYLFTFSDVCGMPLLTNPLPECSNPGL